MRRLILLLVLFAVACSQAEAGRRGRERRTGPNSTTFSTVFGLTNLGSWDNTTGTTGDYEYLTLDNTDGDVDGATQLTWAAWLNGTKGQTNQMAGTWGADSQWLVNLNSTGTLRFTINEAGDFWQTDSTEVEQSGWWHICTAYNSGIVTVYINGASFTVSETGTVDSAIKSGSTGDIHVGPVKANGQDDFQREVDDWALWVGDALTEAECQAVYNGTPSSAGTFTHWLKFNNDFTDEGGSGVTQGNGTGDYLFSTLVPYEDR